MNQPSAFQLQYPLSPIKFWKKMFDVSAAWLMLFIFLGGGVSIFVFIGLGLLPGLASLAAVGLVFAILVFFPYSIYVKAYIKRYYYDCGDQFITIKKGVFAPTEIHVQYQKIQDVYVDQDILDRMMGLFDVHIASATVTSGIEAHIDGVNAEVAENLKNIILAKIHNVSNSPTVSAEAPAGQSQKPNSVPEQFNQKISSETYPISGKWIWSAFFSAISTAIYFSFFIAIIFFRVIYDSPDADNSLLYWFVWLVPIIFICSFVAKYIWKNNFYFEFMPDYVLLRTGIISRQENHLPYKSIQNVLNKQSIFDRMLGLSTVTIQNAAQQMVASSRGQTLLQGLGVSLLWQPKEKAEELNNILNDIVSKISSQNSSGQMGV